MPEFELGELAQRLDAELIGDPQARVSGLGSLPTAERHQLSHLSSASYSKDLPGTRAGAVLLKPDDADACPTAALICDNPYLAFARASQLFFVPEPLGEAVHPAASVHPGATVHPTARIGAHASIGEGSTIGAGARVHANVTVGARCEVAEDVVLYPNAVLYSDVHVGARSVVHSGAVIGADGFGFTPDATGRLETIAQLGGVRVGADVSIGANSCVDRGAIDHTVIEDGVKIDNQVQIGHNCHIGAHTIICGCVGIAGSTRIGRHCVFAGGSGAGGEKPIEICDGVVVSAVTTITSSVDEPGVYSGSVLHNSRTAWKRNAIQFQSLDKLAKRVRQLERAVERQQSDEEL